MTIDDDIDLNGRVVLITGASTGIGKATAADLAGRGAELILACRNEAKARPVIEELIATTGNGSIELLALDLGDLRSVRDAATAFLATDRALHALVNNAGLAGQRGTTTDGFELAFGTNHLGHFLFTTLLLDRLSASATPGAPTRIVNVASGAHFDAPGIDFDALQQSTPSVVGMREYSVSKLANVLFTQQLAQRVDPAEVVAFATDPGPVHTDVWRRIPGPIYAVFRRVMRLKPVEAGAAPSIFCLIEPGLEAHSGAYVNERCQIVPPSPIATPALGEQLWERSEAWVRGA